MSPKMKKYGTVDEYLADQPDDVRKTLERVRRSVLAVVPKATEKIGYGMPGFYVEGRPLVYYSAFKEHCSLFPASAGVIERLADDLKGYGLAKGHDPVPHRQAATRAVDQEDREGEARGAQRLNDRVSSRLHS